LNAINPTDRLTVELQAQQWNQFMVLAEAGFVSLMQNLQTQLQNPKDDPAHQPTFSHKTNGAEPKETYR